MCEVFNANDIIGAVLFAGLLISLCIASWNQEMKDDDDDDPDEAGG